MSKTKRVNVKDLSGNSLCELMGLVNQINCLINQDYLHVSDYFPASLKADINKFEKILDKEMDRREDEF